MNQLGFTQLNAQSLRSNPDFRGLPWSRNGRFYRRILRFVVQRFIAAPINWDSKQLETVANPGLSVPACLDLSERAGGTDAR